jgi:hypothetical protein
MIKNPTHHYVVLHRLPQILTKTGYKKLIKALPDEDKVKAGITSHLHIHFSVSHVQVKELP